MSQIYTRSLTVVAAMAILTACETTPLADDTEPPTITVIIDTTLGILASDPDDSDAGCPVETVTGPDGETRSFEPIFFPGGHRSSTGSAHSIEITVSDDDIDQSYIHSREGDRIPTKMLVVARDNGPMNTMTTGFLIVDDSPRATDNFDADIVPAAPGDISQSNTTFISPFEFENERFLTTDRYPEGLPRRMFAFETHPTSGPEGPVLTDGLLLGLHNLENLDQIPALYIRAVDMAGNVTTFEPLISTDRFCFETPPG
ncbi:MAG: hypothetical protein AAFW65_00345 [Pseudomonadota bacterium]